MRYGLLKKTKTTNTAEIRDDGIIYLTFTGPQTAANTTPIYEKTKELIAHQRAAGKRVMIFGDVTGITTQDSGSRVQAKRLMSLDFDANAIYGTSKLMPIIMYVMRSSGYNHVRAFRSKHAAMAWLHGEEQVEQSLWPPLIGLALVGFALVAIAGAIGGHESLQRFYHSFAPIQPLEAIALLAIGASIIAARAKRQKVQQGLGLVAALLGLSMLLPDTHLDISAVSGWSFMLAGIASMVWGEHDTSTRRVCRGAIIGVIILALINSNAYAYSPAFLFDYAHYFTASPLLSVLLVCFAVAYFLHQHRKRGSVILARSSWISLSIILAIILVQSLTALSWRNTRDAAQRSAYQAYEQQIQESSSAIGVRLQTYVNALYGFRGLYNSSDKVTEGDFTQYYNSLNLAEQYPGFRAISFIQVATPGTISSLVQEARTDKTLHPEGNPAFAMPTASDQYFIVRYVAGGRGTGTNFALDTTRVANYSKARDSGQPSASSTIDFPATATQPAARGFFISIPIYKSASIPTTVEARQATIVGFVNAVFNYNTLFDNVLKSVPGFGLQIFDQDGMKDTAPFFSISDKTVNQTPDDQLFTDQKTIYAAGRPWVLTAQARKDFGGDKSQEKLALTILYAGNALVLVLFFVLWLETQSKRRAMRLADAMTQDLNAERNNAIAVQHKDEALLSSIGDGVFALDNDGHIILFNKAAQEITGFTADEVLGKHYAEGLHFINESTAALETLFIEHALKGKVGSMSKHTAIVHKSGHRVPVADSAAPIIDAQGKQIGAIVVFRDVTHERQLEQAKDEFVSLVSHQLRTPLTAIRLFVEMLLAEDVGKLNASQHDYLSKVDTSTQRMIQLVGDFLNTSRIELGRLKVDPVPTHLDELVKSHIDEIQPLADAKHITLRYKAHKLPEAPIDQSLYGQVVHNLLTNAIRYTPENGMISVSIHKTAHGFQLDVSDSGIGIPKEAQGKLFQRFFRADNAIKVEGEGSGLGLYLIKKIVELCKGKIWFESEVGKGTTFHVIIPEEGMKAKAGVASLK